MSKISEKYLGVYLDILCSFTKFHEENIFFVAFVKKTNFGAAKLLFG
jgi:hypothetical protein